MTEVSTVQGPLPVEQLGRTLMHEHIFVLTPEILDNYPEDWGDEELRVQAAIEDLRRVKESGFDSLVDMTVLGLGRSIRRIERIGAATAINILVATGIYLIDSLPGYFKFRGPGMTFDEPERMVKLFVRDIEVGIAGTGVRAAVIKCSSDEAGITPDIARAIRAVADAHHLTGAPISTHTDAPSKQGLEQQRELSAAGVDLGRVLIGHCGDSTDIDYLEALIDSGSMIGMDRFGLDFRLPFEPRIDTIVRLCEKGYADRMVLSQDAACYSDQLGDELVREKLPNWHHLHIAQDVLPELRRRGVSDGQLDQMLVTNPRKFFSSS